VSTVVLSPHLDDAVFSCWHVLTSSQDVLVINVFSGIPAPDPVPDWDRMTGASDSAARMAERLEEDRRALSLTGCRGEYLGYLDSQYRNGPADLTLSVPSSAAVFAPAGIGGHSDHEAVRDAALGLAAEVTLYADLPYATEFGLPGSDPLRDIDFYWSRFVPKGFEPRTVELDQAQQASKIEAMRAYRTQFAILEGGPLRRLTHPDLIRFEVLFERVSG
jgi:LmbE family N-acetylglucosaminyl deacetylase